MTTFRQRRVGWAPCTGRWAPPRLPASLPACLPVPGASAAALRPAASCAPAELAALRLWGWLPAGWNAKAGWSLAPVPRRPPALASASVCAAERATRAERWAASVWTSRSRVRCRQWPWSSRSAAGRRGGTVRPRGWDLLERSVAAGRSAQTRSAQRQCSSSAASQRCVWSWCTWMRARAAAVRYGGALPGPRGAPLPWLRRRRDRGMWPPVTFWSMCRLRLQSVPARAPLSVSPVQRSRG